MKAHSNPEAQEAIAEIEEAPTISTIPSEQTAQKNTYAGFLSTMVQYKERFEKICKGLDEIIKKLDEAPLFTFTLPSAWTGTDDTDQDKMAPPEHPNV